MNQEIYADGINAIHITGNMVRIDLMTLQPHLKSDNGQPVFDSSRRIIMPLEAFVESLSMQEKIVEQLLKSGIVKRTDSLQTTSEKIENV